MLYNKEICKLRGWRIDMKSKQIYALLLSTTIIASAFPVEAASYDNVVDAIKAVNNGTDASATYNVTANTNVYDKSDTSTQYGYGVVNGTLNMTGNGSQTANVYGVLNVSPTTTNPNANPKVVITNIGSVDVDSLDSDYSLTVHSKWTNLTPTEGAPLAALIVQHGELDISNSVFAGSRNISDTTSEKNGGAIQTKGDSILKVDGSIFYDNQAKTYGGAIDIDGTNDKATITESVFIKNAADLHAGAIDIHSTDVQLTDNSFYDNSAPWGGAVYVHEGASTDITTTDTAYPTLFEANKALEGGAIYGAATSDINIEGAVFNKNQALSTASDAADGSAIYSAGVLTTKNSTFKNNEVTGSNALGGTVYIHENGSYVSTGDTFTANTVSTDGGAVLNKGSVTMRQAKITNNKAGSEGGGIYNTGIATVASSTVSGNEVARGGGIYNTGTATITNTTISNNKATGNGGGIYNTGTLTLQGSGNKLLTNTTGGVGSHVYNAAGGTLNIVNAKDDIDLDYAPYTNKTAPTNPNRLLSEEGDIYNGGTININNSELQLHKAGINTHASLTASRNLGTVNINNSRIDLGEGGVDGKGTIHGNAVNINQGSTIQTHVGKETDPYGKIGANTITVSKVDTSLNLYYDLSDALKKGETRTYHILDASTVNQDFEEALTNQGLYTVKKLGDGKYQVSYPAGTDSDTPDDPDNSDTPDNDRTLLCPGCDRNETSTAEGWDIYDTPVALMPEGTEAREIQQELWETATVKPKEYRDALDGLAPDVSPLIQAHATEITRRLSAVISERFYNSMERTGYVHRGKRFYRFPRHDSNLWVQGLYGKSKYDVRKGWDMDTKGIAVGFDGHVTDALRMGVSYAYTKADGDSVGRETTIDSHTGTIYGEYNPNRYYANWLAMYTRSEYDEDKKVFDHNVTANYDVDAIGAQVMLGRKMGPYVRKDWASGVIKPEIGMRYLYTKQHGYTDSVGQKVGSADGHTLTGILGAQYTIGYTLSPTLSWYPELRAALTYDFIEPDTSMRVNLLNGSTYEVKTENMDRFGIEVGARVGLDINRKAEVSLEYEGLFKGDYTNHTGLANLKYKF